jgi:aminoglycoside phosphotransferase (APT) family kinase protein
VSGPDRPDQPDQPERPGRPGRPAPILDDGGGLLNWPRLQDWIEARDLPGSGPVTGVRQLTGGSQNNIFRLEREGASLILRRPPRHPRENSNRTIEREARVLAALAATAVPHPRLYALCDTTSVIGTYFYLMAPVDGFTPSGQLPGAYATEADWRRSLAYGIVDAAVELAKVRPGDVGLADERKAAGWLERQVPRWLSQLEGYAREPAYRGLLVPEASAIGEWLERHRPRECVIGIIHGDLQFANVMFAHDRPELLAVVDWELSTLGDPLLDLGWILTSWFEPGDPPGRPPYVLPAEGLPTRRELVERYVAATGRDPSLVQWYFVLACFKLAIIVEGTYVRSLSGQASVETGDRLHGIAVWLLKKAAQLIDS